MPKKLKKFTLDFSRWCRKAYHDPFTDKCCAIGQYNIARDRSPCEYHDLDDGMVAEVVEANDQEKISRTERMEKIRKAFAKYGIVCEFTNIDYGMKKKG